MKTTNYINSVNDGNNFKPIVLPTHQLREMAAKAVLDEIGKILFRISSTESGRLLESSLQLLPDDAFKTLAFLVVGSETDEITRAMIYELAFRIAQKLGMEFQTPEPITDAAENIMVLVNAENLRRKGHVEYLAPNDIFTSQPKQPGYNKLTDAGREIYYKEMLEKTEKPKYVM
jgi:hypothetical protein